MNTCKTALRILKSRKMYLVIYLGFIGIMMFAISWQIMRGSMTGGDEVFHPDTARVAVVDRDGDADARYFKNDVDIHKTPLFYQ